MDLNKKSKLHKRFSKKVCVVLDHSHCSSLHVFEKFGFNKLFDDVKKRDKTI